MPKADPTTKTRLIAAASELFAAHGFHGTTARDIAGRAGVNLAACNYHYGSKKTLYLAVLRAQFAEIRARLTERGASRTAPELARLSRGELAILVRRRTEIMLDILIGPPPGLHGGLMQREMTDPTEALPVIVKEFIVPMQHEMEAIVSHLAPRLPAKDVERCVFSIFGQVVFYRFAMPAMLLMLDRPAYPRGFTRQLAEHIVAFSLGGIERRATRGRA